MGVDAVERILLSIFVTPPKFKISPEIGWLEYYFIYFPFGMVTFQGLGMFF